MFRQAQSWDHCLSTYLLSNAVEGEQAQLPFPYLLLNYGRTALIPLANRYAISQFIFHLRDSDVGCPFCIGFASFYGLDAEEVGV